jgi:hypothetical protein
MVIHALTITHMTFGRIVKSDTLQITQISEVKCLDPNLDTNTEAVTYVKVYFNQ